MGHPPFFAVVDGGSGDREQQLREAGLDLGLVCDASRTRFTDDVEGSVRLRQVVRVETAALVAGDSARTHSRVPTGWPFDEGGRRLRCMHSDAPVGHSTVHSRDTDEGGY